MIKDFIKRLNNLGYYNLNNNFELTEIEETDKLKIQTINPYWCCVYIEPEKITITLNVKKLGYIESNIVDEVLY